MVIVRFRLISLVFCLIAWGGAVAPVQGQCAEIPDCALVWADEFDGTSVDLDKWSFQLGDGSDVGIPGWGNNELQYYREENATVSGGLLTITARQESVVPGFDYTSARLRTLAKGDWTFGRMEMRAKMPIGQGLWPAFWLLSSDPSIYGRWAASGEIDIVEYIGSEPDRAFGTIHYGATFPGNVFSATDIFLPSGTFNDDFHIFAVEWDFGEIRWYLDDVEFARRDSWFSSGGPFPAPFDVDFHLLLNLAVGGTLPGNPDDTTVFPQELVVDYVRVYQSPNDAPSVEITSPSASDTLNAGEDLTIQVNATDDGSIARVEFLQGQAILGEVTEPPFELTVPRVASGCYTLTARARDDDGVLAVSEAVEILVGDGCVQAPYRMTPTPIPGVVEVEDYDLGGQGVAYDDADPINAGGAYRADEGIDLEGTTDAGFGFNVGFVNDGEWLEQTVDVVAGTYDVVLRVASNEDGGALHLEFDGVDKTGAITFSGTGGWQIWTDVTVEDVTLEGGLQTLRVQMLDSDFNLNRITIDEPAPEPPTEGSLVFDDMEHGNPFGNGWFTFPGALGGGGISPITGDVPPTDGGEFAMDSGWGSGGVPGFFGGFGRRNPVDLTHVESFSFWINPNADQDYTLEINLQEDDNGDGVTTPPDDDEFQYACVVSPVGPCAIAGGGWQLVTIPLTDFELDRSFLFGGNGVLDPFADVNGELISVVFAVVSNAGSDVNFRTDYWLFERPANTTPVVWDDFEDGNAFDWIFFGGNQAGGGGGTATDRPAEGAVYLSTGWGGQGSSSFFYGGFFKNIPESDQLPTPVDPWFNVWILNQSNATVDAFTLEFTLREDLDGNGWTNGEEDSFRFDRTFYSQEFNDQWTLVSAPLSSFVDLATGGDGTFDGRLDEVVVVVSGVEGAADTAVEVDFDYFVITSGGPFDPCSNESFDNDSLEGWTLDGIGHSNQFAAEVTGGVLELTSDGATAYLGADNVGLLYRELTGDFRVETTVDVTDMDTGKEWRKAGLMARASLDHLDLRLFATALAEKERLQFAARTSFGGRGNVKLGLEVPNAPSVVDLAIERSGQTLSVQYSFDGRETWITPANGLGGSVEIPDLPATLLVGPAVMSNNISVAATARFDDVTFCTTP